MSERNDQVLRMAAVMESKCKSQCVHVGCDKRIRVCLDICMLVWVPVQWLNGIGICL